MNAFIAITLAAMSVYDYPVRQLKHDQLRNDFVTAVRTGDTKAMVGICREGVKLLPDDPTWQYNLACALAYMKNPEPALDALEKAIDLGFRNAEAIKNDTDLKRLEKQPRFKELVEYAEEKKNVPLLDGPLATVPAMGIMGQSIALGEQNLAWNFDFGCFEAQLQLVEAGGGNAGDLYFNRDQGHSTLVMTNWTGLTQVKLDLEGRRRGLDVDFPNILFPYPVFGNASRAYTANPGWRSIPRALMTTDAYRLKMLARAYLGNQFWVFPAVDDVPPEGKFGDVFSSVTPYWIATRGRSWSDQYYLRAGLEISCTLHPNVKKEIVRRGLLAPTIQYLIRRNLKTVKSEEDYLSEKAHPTAFPPNGLDMARLKSAAAKMTPARTPPVAIIRAVQSEPIAEMPTLPELTYNSPCAWAWILRANDKERIFTVRAAGAEEYAFRVVHDEKKLARLETVSPDAARITIDRSGMTPTNRIDLAVFAKSGVSDWGAPSFVSFAVVDPAAPYSDPALTPMAEVKVEEKAEDGTAEK